MKVNGLVHRFFKHPDSSAVIRVHLGPGQKRYIPGWLNLDANMFTGKCDVWVDLRNTLPFRTGAVAAFYSHHMVEHLPDLEKHFKDVYRCLRPGGVYRVAGPNGDAAIRKFVEADAGWFPDWPDNRYSIGGRLENFIICRGEHRTILTESFLFELMSNAGFTDISKVLPMTETKHPDLFQDCLSFESEKDFETPRTLVLEAVKS